MTRLNLSELAKQRLEKSHLRYEYQPYSNTGRIVSTYPDYKGDEYTVCMHAGLNDDRYDSNILKSKIENEFPQFISSVNVYRNINGNEKFKNFGSSYNAKTGETVLLKWSDIRSDVVESYIKLNCDEISIGDEKLNVNVDVIRENKRSFEVSKLYPDILETVAMNDEYFKEKKHVEKSINTDDFNIENCKDYKQNYNIDMERSFVPDRRIGFDAWSKMDRFERYQYVNDKNNQIPVDIIKTKEIASYLSELPIKGLLHVDTDFLSESIDYFNDHSKSREFDKLFDKGNKNFSEVKITQMLLDENVIDNNIYKEFQDEYLNYHTDQFNKMSTKPEENNSHLDYSEQDFINAINEVNETAQSRIDTKDERLKEEDIDRSFRAVMSKMQSAIIKAEYEEEQAKKSNNQGLIR